MEKNKIYVFFATLLAVVLLSSCSGGVPDYAKLIPKDAGIVLRVDVKQLADKSGYSDNDKLKKKLESAMKDNLSGKAKKKALAILDDPAEAGLDLRDPVFIYATEKMEFGIVGAIYDADKFTELLNTVAEEGGNEKVKKSDGLRYIVMNDLQITFNDDWFYITGENGDNPKETAKEALKRYESGSKSIVDNEGFKKMCDKDGIAQLYVSGKWIAEKAFKQSRYNYYTEEYEEVDYSDEIKEKTGANIEDLEAVFDVAMDDGEARASVELVAANDKGEKAIDELDEMMGDKGERFFFRFNFGFIDKIAKQLSGYDKKQAEMASKLLRYVEMEYEGDGKLTLLLKTNDKDNTPLQTILEMVQKEIF